MKKWIVVLKSAVLFIWLSILILGIDCLSQALIGGTPLLMASQKENEAKKEDKAGNSQSREEENRENKLQAFLNHAKEEAKKGEKKAEAEKKKDESRQKKAESKNEKDKKPDSEDRKYAYLTFDDGPSDNTDRILDILKEKGVEATFFVVGKTDAKSKERYMRILDEGHSLGMHSYTHDYQYIYGSLEHYKEDLMKLSDYLYDVTGVRPVLYRFPGGSSNSVSKIPIQSCIQFLDEKGILYFDWNASSEDAVLGKVSCERLNKNILKDALLYRSTVILMHDLHECSGTVDGLGSLIDRLKEEGYEMRKITKDTVPVQHVKDASKEKTEGIKK